MDTLPGGIEDLLFMLLPGLFAFTGKPGSSIQRGEASLKQKILYDFQVF